MDLDMDRIAEVKVELDKNFKDLSKTIDLHRSSASLGFKNIQEKLMDNFYISGSHIYNLYNKIDPSDSDIDFFFKNKDYQEKFENLISTEKVTPIDYGAAIAKSKLYVSSKAYTISFAPLFSKINFIFYQHTKEFTNQFADVVNLQDEVYFNQSFDFMHCCAVYEPKSQMLTIPEQTADAFVKKELRVNPRITSHLGEFIQNYEKRMSVDKTSTPKTISNDDLKVLNYIQDLFKRYQKFLNRGMTPTPHTEIFYRKLEIFINEVTK